MKPTSPLAVVSPLFLRTFRLARCCNALLSKTDAHLIKAFRSFTSVVGMWCVFADAPLRGQMGRSNRTEHLQDGRSWQFH